MVDDQSSSSSSSPSNQPMIGSSSSASSSSSSLVSSWMIPLYIGWRIWWSNRMPLMDCDEVYNYWEPLHFLLFQRGFQTWEYSNEFALRTYAYLTPLQILANIWQKVLGFVPNWWWPLLTDQLVLLIGSNNHNHNHNNNHNTSTSRVALFILLRASLAAGMAMSELFFCKAIYNHIQKNQNQNQKQATTSTSTTSTSLYIPLVTGILLLTSAGMSHSSAALLPSSTLMCLWMTSAAFFLQHQHFMFAGTAIVATLALGWPFGVLMFVPLGFAVLYREFQQRTLVPFFLVKVVIVTVVIQTMVMIIDKQQYQRWVSPTWNIFLYNTKAQGDELYGIEPWTYYVKNLLLNFNYVSIVGIVLVVPIFLLSALLGNTKQDYTLWMLLVPQYLWLAIVFPRPHKEERFLFPIYPSICLGAAIVGSIVADGMVSLWFQYRHYNTTTTTTTTTNQQSTTTTSTTRMIQTSSLILQALLWLPSMIFSLSRTMALSKYYTAPLYVYSQLQNQPDVVDSIICTCGEWYRFPSSFYLPSTIQSFAFLPSSFEGQLPQLFLPLGSGPPPPSSSPNDKDNDTTTTTTTATTVPYNQFNDQNKPEPGQFVYNMEDCDYLIDLFSSQDCRENDSIWKPIAHAPFLDAERTTSTIHRIFYIPFWHEQQEEEAHRSSSSSSSNGGTGVIEYVDYILYQKQTAKY